MIIDELAELSVLELVFEVGTLASAVAAGEENQDELSLLDGELFGLIEIAQEPG